MTGFDFLGYCLGIAAIILAVALFVLALKDRP